MFPSAWKPIFFFFLFFFLRIGDQIYSVANLFVVLFQAIFQARSYVLLKWLVYLRPLMPFLPVIYYYCKFPLSSVMFFPPPILLPSSVLPLLLPSFPPSFYSSKSIIILSLPLSFLLLLYLLPSSSFHFRPSRSPEERITVFICQR